MAGQDKHQHIEISDGERAVTSADVATSRDGQGPARASLWAASGHIPPGSRARLVDAVLDLPEVQGSPGLQATVPLGDAESLQRLRDRCEDMTTRAAGSSALVDAAPRRSHTPDDPQLQARAALWLAAGTREQALPGAITPPRGSDANDPPAGAAEAGLD